MCKHCNEATIHSRVRSKHFIGDIKRGDDLPQIFPWQPQKHRPVLLPNQSAAIKKLTPLKVVNHDH